MTTKNIITLAMLAVTMASCSQKQQEEETTAIITSTTEKKRHRHERICKRESVLDARA